MLVVGGWRFWDLEIGVALPLALGLTASSAGGSGAGRGVGELGVRTRECAVGVAKLGGVESVWWWTGGEANHFVLSRCAMQGGSPLFCSWRCDSKTIHLFLILLIFLEYFYLYRS